MPLGNRSWVLGLPGLNLSAARGTPPGDLLCCRIPPLFAAVGWTPFADFPGNSCWEADSTRENLRVQRRRPLA